MARKPIKVIDAKLARSGLLGRAYIKARKIEVDFDSHGHERELLDTVCHEVLHVSSNDFLSEDAIEKLSADLADVLYRMKWRRVIE